MGNQKETPFASVLEALFHAEDLPVHLVYRLSDLSPLDFERFKVAWKRAAEARRVALVGHMADIAEENYLIDFTPIFVHLFEDSSSAVRIAALDGVWDSEDQALVSPILQLLRSDEDSGVRAAAARALAHYILLAEWGQIDGSHTDMIVDGLLAEYDNPRAAREVKRAALEAVSPAAHSRIPDLINDAYEEGDNDMQLSAIFAMGVSADDRWLPILEEELTSPSPDFRAEAARACGIIGNQDSLDALEALVDDSELEVGIAAIMAIGQIGGERASGLLSRLAENPDYEDYYDAIEEALDEMEWMDSGLDLLAFADDDDDDDDILNELRLN
jgi:HEAT repeat protein